MSMSDPIADMLTRVRNALRNRSKVVDCLNSKVCRGIADVLLDEGYIEGYETSAVVTLRRDRMWHFLDRLINLATPRIKDFRGLPTTSFDGQGNYSFGLTEQGVFPEINMAEVSFTHGMNINLTFSNSTPERSAFLLAQLGMPFKRPEQN